MKWRVGCVGKHVGRVPGRCELRPCRAWAYRYFYRKQQEESNCVSLTTGKWKDAKFTIWKKTRHFKHLFLNFGLKKKKKSIHHKKKSKSRLWPAADHVLGSLLCKIRHIWAPHELKQKEKGMYWNNSPQIKRAQCPRWDHQAWYPGNWQGGGSFHTL